jgi:hypothetical protein
MIKATDGRAAVLRALEQKRAFDGGVLPPAWAGVWNGGAVAVAGAAECGKVRGGGDGIRRCAGARVQRDAVCGTGAAGRRGAAGLSPRRRRRWSMIFTRGLRVCLAAEPADLRRSFEGLALLVKEALKEDERSSQIFVFTNRRRRRLSFSIPIRHGDHRIPVASIVWATTARGSTKGAERCRFG